MKILEVDCAHPYLSADHCLMWSQLGLEWYNTGYYAMSNGCGDLPKIPTYFANNKFRQKLKKCGNSSKSSKILNERYKTFTGINIQNVWKFTSNFTKDFDVFVFSHDISNVINNLDIIGNKKIIFLTFGMHDFADEPKIGVLRALKKIIRVSNNEYENLRSPLYGGYDRIIHGSVVPNEDIISGWTGKKCQVCTFTNGFNCIEQTTPRREFYIKIKQGCPNYKFKLYGANNENESLGSGFVSMNEKIKIMQESRVHLVTGTPGSSCTYSLVESMVMGAPTVCYGQKMWRSPIYEPSKLFSHGEEILIGETPEECSDYINLLMKDKDLCQYLSKNARKKAVSIYGRKILAGKWKKLFQDTGIL